MSRNSAVVIVILLILLIVGGVYYTSQRQVQEARLEAQKAVKEKEMLEMKIKKEKEEAAKMNAVNQIQIIQLAEINKSGESGTAEIKALNGNVVVTLALPDEPKDAVQPAHIHIGNCPDVGEVKFPLASVINGKSQTTLKITMDQLAKMSPLAINIHKSASDIKTYVACGNFQNATPSAMKQTH